jgi:hypothetical protein
MMCFTKGAYGMKRERRFTDAVLAMMVLGGGAGLGGVLSPPSTPGPVMRTVETLYQQQAGTLGALQSFVVTNVLSDATTLVSAGSYGATDLAAVEPDLVPENIAKDVDIFGVVGTYEAQARSLLPQTGVTVSRRTGDDGDLEQGVVWPSPRFVDNGNGTVTDALTGLMWVKAPHSLSGNDYLTSWSSGLNLCNALVFAGHDDWRLPSLFELQSLRDLSQSSLVTWLNGQGFSGIKTYSYWSGTVDAGNTANAWNWDSNNGLCRSEGRTYGRYTWPVRGGE